MNIFPIMHPSPLSERRKHYVNAGPLTQEPLGNMELWSLVVATVVVGGRQLYLPARSGSYGINEGRGHFGADVAAHPGAGEQCCTTWMILTSLLTANTLSACF